MLWAQSPALTPQPQARRGNSMSSEILHLEGGNFLLNPDSQILRHEDPVTCGYLLSPWLSEIFSCALRAFIFINIFKSNKNKYEPLPQISFIWTKSDFCFRKRKINSFCGIFHVSENLESGPGPGCQGSGCSSLLSLLLCSCFLISFHLEKRCFIQSASQTRPAASCALCPSLGGHKSFPGFPQN